MKNKEKHIGIGIGKIMEQVFKPDVNKLYIYYIFSLKKKCCFIRHVRLCYGCDSDFTNCCHFPILKLVFTKF